jgi:hypothetical protein
VQQPDRRQRRQLALFLKFRDGPVSVFGLIRANLRIYAVVLLAALFLAFIADLVFGSVGPLFVAAALYGLLLRDWGYLRRTARLWPAFRKIILWEKLGHEAGSDPDRPDDGQRRQLDLLLKFKDRPISIFELIWSSRRIYTIIFTFGLLFAWLEYYTFGYIGFFLVVTVLCGLFLRDLIYFWHARSFWPVFRDMIAWEKLE